MLYIILALLFYTAAIMLGTIASRNTNSNLVSAIMNAISAIIPIIVVFPIVNKKLFESGKLGILMAVLSGIAIAFFTLALNKSFQVNKVAIVSPIVFGGAIFLSAILSAIFFKEKVSTFQMFGLAFLGMGLITIIYAAATGK
jgi:uncharacterized membrane protein